MELGKRSFSRFNDFQHNVARGEGAQLAVPFGFAVFVYLRGWAGALVFAAARVSGNSAGAIYAGDAAPGILDEEVLRAAVHGFVRAAGGDSGQLARSAEFEADADEADSAAPAAPPGTGAARVDSWQGCCSFLESLSPSACLIDRSALRANNEGMADSGD